MSIFLPTSLSPVLSFTIWFFLLLITCCWGCNPQDRAALLAFSNALDSPVWLVANSTAPDCCSWVGVTCSGNASSTPSSRRIVELILENMRLSGPVPRSLGRLDRLKLLDLYGNNLSGPIPDELFRPRYLEQINLSKNNLSGPLTSAFGKLSRLVMLDVSINSLSGPIPDAFHRLKNLNYFIASENNFVGSLPASLSSCSKLSFLHLRDNNLSGQLVLNFTALPQLESLLLQNNHFTGRIPHGISSCGKLGVLFLAGNRFHGQMPWGFKFPPSLRFVLLGYNNFSNISRALLSLQGCRNLTGLHLSGSFRKEEMPQDMRIQFPNLKALSIASSELSGSFPMWLSKSAKLIMLNLSHNYLTGEIPVFLTQLKSLIGSKEQNDYVHSAITDERFAGVTFHLKPTLDLSANLLSGNTWMRLSNLAQLVQLNLSHNSFTGSIPDEFSLMRSLQSLDLSSNKISGALPSSLQRLTYLSFFCVANNNLNGDVPTGSQFLTFPSSCFDGNPGLCYLGKIGCHSPALPATKSYEQFGGSYKVIDMGIPFAIGVSAGYATTFFAGGMHFWLTRSKLPTKNKRRQ